MGIEDGSPRLESELVTDKGSRTRNLIHLACGVEAAGPSPERWRALDSCMMSISHYWGLTPSGSSQMSSVHICHCSSFAFTTL